MTGETKPCEGCDGEVVRGAKCSRAQFARTRFCSVACRNIALTKPAIIDSHGYYKVRRNGRYYLRSRVVVEEAYGPLPPGAVVHHINQDRTDDRLENLRVFASNSEHMRFHALNGDIGFQAGNTHGRRRLKWIRKTQ